MKIDVVGNGCTWTKELSTSFIINDEILYDVPQGSFKRIMHEYDLSKINYIIISHFHSDHFADLHIVLDYLFNNYPDKNYTIIAPKGCYERICSLFRIFEVSYREQYLKERVTFIDCENGKKFKLGGFKFKAFQMFHRNLDCFGFVIEENGVKVGFTSDTAMCNNVRKILKASKACFIDSSNVQPNNKHLSYQEVLSLQEEFPDCKIHMIHLSEDAMKQLDSLKKAYPKEKDVIYID